jgi:hypothetical protein
MNISQVNPNLGMPGSFSGSSLGLSGGSPLLGGSSSILPGGVGDSLSLSDIGGVSGLGSSGGLMDTLRQIMQMLSTLLSTFMGGGLGGMGSGLGDLGGGLGGTGSGSDPYASGGSPSGDSGSGYGGGSPPEDSGGGGYGGGQDSYGGGRRGHGGGHHGCHGHGGGGGGGYGGHGGGAPPTGGGAPPTGGETPQTGGETPTTGGETPPTGGQTPPTGGQTPPTGGQTPPTGGQTPPTGGQTPPTGGETPPTGGETPPTGGVTTQSPGAQGNPNSYVGGSGVQNSNSNLPPIDPNQWTKRDGKNPGWEFSTPFVSSNAPSTENSISTKIQGDQGAEVRFNKPIGEGFYQFNVNPQQSSQLGELVSVFLYSNTGSDGGDKTQGFELDAEYNMVRPNSVTFGTWVDGVKYNEITIDAPKGNQTIGFNIQDGKTQIGFVNPDGSFEVKSETTDPRINQEMASHLIPMSNAWRFTNKGGTSQEGSSITITGFGRSDAPGQPVKPV